MNKLFDLDIRTGEVRTLFQDGNYSICGFRNGKLIIGIDGDYYEYCPENGELSEEEGFRAFSEEHPVWNCYPECITEEMTVFSCVDWPGYEKNEIDIPFVEDQFVVSRSGETLCRLEGKGWASRGQIVAKINNRLFSVLLESLVCTTYFPFTYNHPRKPCIHAASGDFRLLFTPIFTPIRTHIWNKSSSIFGKNK